MHSHPNIRNYQRTPNQLKTNHCHCSLASTNGRPLTAPQTIPIPPQSSPVRNQIMTLPNQGANSVTADSKKRPRWWDRHPKAATFPSAHSHGHRTPSSRTAPPPRLPFAASPKNLQFVLPHRKITLSPALTVALGLSSSPSPQRAPSPAHSLFFNCFRD